jgi:hypothetical protein
MKRTTKYVALDVHQATTVSSVRDETGRVIARAIIPTEAESLLTLIRSMRGAVHVVFEEGTQAQWLSELLTPVVQRVVVCNRRGDTTTGTRVIGTTPMTSPISCVWVGSAQSTMAVAITRDSRS